MKFFFKYIDAITVESQLSGMMTGRDGLARLIEFTRSLLIMRLKIQINIIV